VTDDRRDDGADGRPVLLVATGSAHKLRELTELLHLAHGRLVSIADVPAAAAAGEPVEDGATFAVNAAIKARFYARATGLPTLADDSGIEVDALGGGPGVRTRRYAGEDATDERNNVKLLDALAGLPPAERGARYRCVLAFADPRLRAAR
jgi:XTP/dITP diphosphohydrolase